MSGVTSRNSNQLTPSEIARVKQRIALRQQGLSPDAVPKPTPPPPKANQEGQNPMSSGWKGPDAAQQSGTVQVGTVVDFLCDADDQVIAELDRKITNLESQLAKLKRVKRMLAPRQTTGQRRTMQPSAEGEAQIAKICGVLKSQGPLRAKELAAAIGEPSYARVGKLCAASDKIRKRDDGRLELSK